MKRLWTVWKRLARRIGDWQARVVLTIFYYTLFAPFALLARFAKKPRRGWRRRPDPEGEPLARAGRQY
jgi:hypothetical protein